MSLRLRIAAVAGLAVAVTVIAVTAIVYFATRSELRGEVDRSLQATAAGLVRQPPQGEGRGRDRGPGGRPPERPPRDVPHAPPAAFGGAAGFVQRVAPDGAVFRPPGESSSIPVDPGARAVASSGSGLLYADVTVQGHHLRVLTMGAGSRGAIQVARPLDEVDRELDRVLLILIVVGSGGIALAAALGAVVARTALGPIGRFTRRTEALSKRLDLSQRMEVAGGDELGRLARSFNATLEALEHSLESQRQLVADASHELRTPISSLRANIQTLEHAGQLSEVDREALRADIIEELDELTALVGDVVELARGAAPDEALDDVRLDHLVTALVERARRRVGERADLRLRVEPTLVRGEPERIARAVSNLLDNALKWSPPGGLVEVDLADATLTVRDHGPGFDAAELPRVFERFFRSSEARGRPGSGLGLAIVRQAAEAHGGSAEAANAPDGGASLLVRFGPALAPPEAAPEPADEPSPDPVVS
ncbi:MAG: two-component system, OmpR family, sensor histidine kinase MprB [Miltoncostaeaceae bacterium]|nr:two-component system, OmpR family, sensor histidine kinase MprB [Miltoncostaeaceae bacterium]